MTCLWTCLNSLSAVVLDLNEAIQCALTGSPTIMIANSEADVQKSEEYQVGLLPNPIFSVEVDGANSFINKRKGTDRDITYSLSQLFELGGKRAARKRIAAFESSLALYELEGVKLDIRNDVTWAVVDIVAAQEYIKLADEQQHIADEIYSSTAAKVQGGKVSPLQEKKANIARITSKLAVEKAIRFLELAKKKLAAICGGALPDFTEVSYPLFEIAPLEDLNHLIARQCNNLEALKWDMQIAAGEQIVVSEKAQRIPDVVVTAGYVQCQDDGDGVLVGLSIPIPIFDRNQGNICKARQLLNQLYEKKKEGMLRLRIGLEDAYGQLLTAYKEGMAFKEDILSSAKSAFEAAKEEYAQGRNDYLELLDAQRTLFDVQEQYINTLVDYHHKKADVDRLVGTPQIKCLVGD